MDRVMVIWANLKAIGFFPEITLAGMAIYFLMRFFLQKDKMTSIYAILIVNLLGQLYYDLPKTPTLVQDIIGTLFFTIMQMAVAIAIYSFADAVGLLGYLQRFIDKKATDAGIPPKP